jgi:glycosyltransferase involved in cell wall biosynthesis
VAGFVDYSSIFVDRQQGVPVVWTLHDMNPFTGGCHYDAGCQAYISGCGSCPQLGSTTKRDLAYAIFRRKYRALSSVLARKTRIVSPSHWLAREARKSMLFRELEISIIPYGLDVKTFQPRTKLAARGALGIETGIKVILFVADQIDNKRKGFDLLLSAVESLGNWRNILLLTVGGGNYVLRTDLPHCHIGQVNSDKLLPAVYSAADVFVIPSRQDNLAQTALEAVACGTPVVGFDSGGMGEIVRPGITGLLAKPDNVRELRDCIAKLLTDPILQSEIAANCRRIAIEEYSLELQAKRYVDLYKSLFNGTESVTRPDRRIVR